MCFVDRYLCVDFVVELVSKNEKRTLVYEVLMNLKRWVVVVFIRLGLESCGFCYWICL